MQLSLKMRIVSMLGVLVVLASALALLTYVGYGEARRTYPKLQIDALAAQGELVKTQLDVFLLAGLPLEQFPGFAPLSQPIREANSSIAAIYISDRDGNIIFKNADAALALPHSHDFAVSALQEADARYATSESSDYYRVSLDLSNKFEQVGQLHLLLPQSVIAGHINQRFSLVIYCALGLVAAYAAFAFVRITRWHGGSTRWLDLSFAACFLVMSVIVITALVNLYVFGVREKTQALAHSLTQRLSAPIGLGLDLRDFDGLEQTLSSYKELNPDLSVVALTEGDTILIHTDPQLVGTPWTTLEDHYEEGLLIPGTERLQVHVAIPSSVVFSRVWRSAKNFLALFVATAFLCTFFFNMIRAFIVYQEQRTLPSALEDLRLGLIGPLYFLGVFADSLSKSFLPQHFREIATASGLDASASSTLFTVYFASYALALFPAGRFVERGASRALMIAGGLLTAVDLLLLWLADSFWMLVLAQLFAGLGQGILFIAVQSYILQVTSAAQRTRGAAVIIFGFNGGIFSGTAIGALLAADPAMGRAGVFLVGAAVGLLVALYAFALIRDVKAAADPEVKPEVVLAAAEAPPVPAPPAPGVMAGLRRAVQDMRFAMATFLIGIPVKVIMAGLISATLPLLLARQNYRTEDIGQIIMLYSAGVLIANRVTARIADRTGKTDGLLVLGAVGSGIGLILIGVTEMGGLAASVSTLLLVAGLLLLGLGHGCIQAPIVTYISNTSAASTMGRSTATSLYRLFERIGNIGGPILITQLLLLSQESIVAVAWLGGAVAVFGMLFAVQLRRATAAASQVGSSA